MAKVFQEFEFNFKFNDKDASKSIKTISKDLKQMIANFGDASDKMFILKDLVGYLNKVDTSLNDLKTNNKDLFNQIFGSVDKNLTGALSELFGVLDSDMTMLDSLKQRIQDANNSKAKLDVLKRIAEDINSLYEKMGAQKPINIDEMFVRKGSKQAGTDFASRIRILNDAINGFAVNFQDVQQKLKDGFTVGGAGGTGGSSQGNSFETEVQNDIDKLKELRQVYQEIIDAIKGNPIKIEVSKKNDADELSKLINEYQNAISAYNDIANKQDATPDEINEKLAERLRLATLLVNMSKDIELSGSDKAGELVTFNLKTIENAREFLMGLKDTQKKAIENLYNNKLQQIDVDILKKEYLSYDSLSKKVEELYSLKEKMSKLDKTKDKSQYDALDEEYGKINDDLIKIASAMEVDDAVADIFDEIYAATIDKQKAIEKLCEVFNISTQDTGAPSKSANGGQETGDNDSDADEEAEAYGRLQTAIENVKAAVEEKTKAFKDEASTVDTVVNQEIESLTRLKEHLQLIQNIVQELFYEKKPNIAFHAGDLDYYAKTGLKSERLGGSGSALADGYGSYGTGIYTVSNPNAYLKNKENWENSNNKIYTIDLSKYNMFTAQTSEQAEQLYNFLAKLEKFVMSSAGFKDFDDQLNGINIDSLYAEMQNVFKNTTIPMERLQKFINDMKQLIVKMGIDKLDSSKLKANDLDILNGGDRVSTQFMRMLGYQGVNVKGTKNDNTAVGSVIYDLDQSSPYVKAFDSINEAIEYYNQNLSQAGSIQTTFSSTVQTLTEGLEQVCQTIQNMPTAIGEFSTALQPIMQALPNMVSDANNLKDAINNIGNGIDQDALQSISDTLSNMEQSAKNLKETLSGLGDNFGEQGNSALNVKFGDTLKVDLQADSTGILQRISEAVSAIQTKMNTQGADDRQVKVDAMKNNLTQLFKYISDFNNKKKPDGTYQGQEISAAILSDGSISTGFGEDGEVPWNRMASSLVANLTKTLLVDLHSHPLHQLYDGSTYVSDVFSGSNGDLSAFRFSKEIGAQLASMLTGNIMRVLDLSKLTDEQMRLFRTELEDIEKTYTNKPEFSSYSGYGTTSRGTEGVYYKIQSDLGDQHTVTNVFEHFMYEAFERIGLSKDYVDQNIFKKYDLTDDQQLTNLAERLVDLALASQNALSPVERLAQIVSQFGYDTNGDYARSILEGFKKGELTAADAFNQLTLDQYHVNQDTMDSLFTIDSAHEMSTVESLLTQITGTLDAIKSNVANIDGNTSRNTSEQIDRAISDILDIKSSYKDNGYEGINQSLLAGVKSNVDPLNISEYRNREMIDIANEQYRKYIDAIADALTKDDVNITEAQSVVDKYKTAWQALNDAIDTLELYEKRTGREPIDEDTGEVLKYKIRNQRDTLFESGDLDEFLRMLVTVKAKIDTEKNELLPSAKPSESESNESVLNSILSTLETIKSSVSNIEQNTYKGQTEQFNGAINDLLSLKDSMLGQLADYGFIVEKPLYFGAQSTIDPNNVPDSDTTLDLFRKTRSSIIDFLDDIEIISNYDIANLPVDRIQGLLNDFKEAWQLLHDSTKAMDLNIEQSDDKLSDRERERWSSRLSSLTNDLIGDGGKNINLLLQMLTQAKTKIETDRKSLLSSDESTDNKSSTINDSKDINGLLDRIAQAVEAIQAVVQADTGIESDGKNSVKQTEPVTDNRAEQNKLSEQDLAVLGELNETLGRLNEYLASNMSNNASASSDTPDGSGYALESTLQTVKNILNQISGKIDFAKGDDNPYILKDPQGRPVDMYRGIRGTYGGLVSNRYHGGTFSTDSLELAREYAGDTGKIEKVHLSMKNPFEIDGMGALWNQIEYIGDNSDEASQRLHALNAELAASYSLLEDAKQKPISEKEQRNINRGLMVESDTKRAQDIKYWEEEIARLKKEKEAIFSDSNNPYGIKDTNQIVEIAKEKGYDGVIFKNIIDSATGQLKDLSNVMVTFSQDQIHPIETIQATFESAITNFKNIFGDLSEYINMTYSEVDKAIRDAVDLGKKFKAGEISEDEYNNAMSKTPVVKDLNKVLDITRFNPQFAAEILNGTNPNVDFLIDPIYQLLISKMRDRLQNIAKAFNMEDVPLNDLLTVSTSPQPTGGTDTDTNLNNTSGYALESTLQIVKGVLDKIASNTEAIANKKLDDTNTNPTPLDTGADVVPDQQNGTDNAWVNTLTNIYNVLGQILAALTDGTTLSTLVQPLSDAVSALKDVSNGIIQHQKAQKSDTRVAQARIADPIQQDLIVEKAKDAVRSLGADVQIASLDALADGIVRVSGAVKNANGIWEGFTIKVNQADEAVDLSIKKQSAFAKSLNRMDKLSGGDDEDSNPYVYDKAEVEKRAQKHLDEYAAQGKKATVQFKDSGRYTITILEEIDGLSKQIFQTFDENDDKIERTTVTMSNSQKMKLDNLQKKLIDDGITNGLISDKDVDYKDYQQAFDALNNMADAYSKMDNLTDEQIASWKQQIALVQQLGGKVEALIKQRKLANDTKIFESDRGKKLSKFDLDYAKLQKDINIPESFKQQIADARTAIANAADEDALKIAINNWEALKNQIHQTAVEQDLYIEKSKNTNTAPDQFTRDLKSQKTSFGKYKRDIEDAIDVTDELKNRLKDLETELANINDDADLSAWQKKFNSLKTEITAAQSSYKRDKSKYSQQIMGQANAGLKSAGIKKDSVNPTEDQQKIIDKYNELEEQVNKYNEKVNAKQQAETSGIEQTKAALLDLIAAYKQANNIVDAKGNPLKQAYGTAQLQNFSAKYNSLQDRAQGVDLGENYEAVKNLADAYQRLKEAQSQFQVGEDLTTEAGKQKVEEFKRAQIECNRYAQELNKVVTQEEKLRTNSISGSPVAEDFKDDIAGRKKALEDFVNAIPDTEIGKFNAKFTELTYTVKNGDGTFTNMTATLNAARSAIYATTGETEKATTALGRFWNELKGKARGILTYLASMTGFQEAWQQLRQGIQYVREIDAALTELKKVTDETNATYDAFLQTMSKTAGEVGSTVAELTRSAADWSRLGYSIEEAGELAKNTAILMNVSEFDNVNEATEALISSLQAFGYEASNSIEIVDKLNIVGKRLPKLYSNIWLSRQL